MKILLGESYPDYLDSFRLLPYKGLRVNENKISVGDFLILWKKCGFPEPEKIPWIHNGFFIPKGVDAAGTGLYQAGLYYIQEPAAMSPAEFLPVEEGDYILDLCAAPGGKSTELLSKLKKTGVLFANDFSTSRAKALKKNLEMAGAKNAFVTAESPEKLAGYFPSFFQKILVDAPCSGEGMFRVQPAMMRHWETEGPDYYVPIQKKILGEAYKMLAPGGMLMYSTCTFSPSEDEEQVLGFLHSHPDMRAVSLPLSDGFENAKDHEGNALPFVKLYPHRVRGEGQFMALLQRSGEKVIHKKAQPLKWQRDQDVYLLPGGILPEKNLHYLMTGLHIGTVKKNLLIPSQAFAMTLSLKEWPDVLNFSFSDSETMKYLKGETIVLNEDETFPENDLRKKNKKRQKDTSPGRIKMKKETLVCADGWPLGFAVRNRNLLKNLRNPGWVS